MIALQNILPLKHVMMVPHIASKKRLFTLVAKMAHALYPPITQQTVIDCLQAREQLGCTSLNNGAAIPRGKLVGLPQVFAFLFKLKQGLNFDEVDQTHGLVDIVLTLLIPDPPSTEHLALLANITSQFKDPKFCAKLRHTQNQDELFRAVTKAPAAATL